MTQVRLLGRRTDVEPVLRRLQRLGLVQMADARAAPMLETIEGADARAARRADAQLVLGRVDDLLAIGERPRAGQVDSALIDKGLSIPEVAGEVDDLWERVETAQRRLDALREEQLALPDHLAPLAQLVPLVPELARLDEGELGSLHLATTALVLNTPDDEVVDVLRAELTGVLGARFELVWTRVDDEAVGALIVFPRAERDSVHALLGHARVRSVELPARFAGLSPHSAVRAMRRRVAELPELVVGAEEERRSILLPHTARLAAIRVAVAAELERLEAVDGLAATRRAFVASCWVPRRRLERLRTELGGTRHPVSIEEIPQSSRDSEAPVLLHNSRMARPFEPLVRFLDLPRTGSVDPTALMTLVLPVMFGAMVGDVGYGMALLALALLVRRRRPAPGSLLASLTWLLLAGAVCSIGFGVLFGEFFGDLGQRLVGDWAVWRYRGDATALEPLLLLAVLAGAIHVMLGLGLGAWQAIRAREPRIVFEKLGMLLALVGLIGIAARLAGHLPPAGVLPSTAAVVVGLATVVVLRGVLGVATVPLDLLGTIGNVLSYLRLAAVGLASAHLAGVANELGTVGPIWMGILVAVVFHLLNLALAAFSPTIQALRLHYIEFFGVFFTGGGKAFTPFGRDLQPAGGIT